MKEILEGLASNSEYHAIALLLVIGLAESQGWMPMGSFFSAAIPLGGYAGLRVSSKTGKNAVANLRSKRGTNQAHGGREVEK
jgi:hypothetical protein